VKNVNIGNEQNQGSERTKELYVGLKYDIKII
jgi:hypothetical protein